MMPLHVHESKSRSEHKMPSTSFPRRSSNMAGSRNGKPPNMQDLIAAVEKKHAMEREENEAMRSQMK